ncbi:MAG: acyltransferase [Acetobacter sp.]|nr:acyltransferase [Acetobacter sp.]
MKEKFLLIQGLRAYACVCVVFEHLYLIYAGNKHIPITSILDTIDFGHLGVIQFFFISGFVITMVAMRESQFEFIVKRFFRIFPPILFSLLLIVAAYVLCHLTHTMQFIEANSWKTHVFPGLRLWNELKVGEFFKNLFLAGVGMNGVMWTLVVESAFYVLVFLFLPMIKQKPVQLYTSIGSIFGLWYILKRCDIGGGNRTNTALWL